MYEYTDSETCVSAPRILANECAPFPGSSTRWLDSATIHKQQSLKRTATTRWIARASFCYLIVALWVTPAASFPLAPVHSRHSAVTSRRQILADTQDIESHSQQHQRKDHDKPSQRYKKQWEKIKGALFVSKFPGKRKQQTSNNQETEQEPMIRSVDNIQEYKKYVVQEADNNIVVVRFYAPWCRACKAVEIPYRKLARKYALQKNNKTPQVKFVEVPLTKGKSKGLQKLTL